MSYCNRASCLAHHRAIYWNLQDRAWVHTDGWPCDGQAFYDEGPRDRHYCGTSALPHQPGPACSVFASPAPAAELAEPRDQAPGPAEVYAAVTLDTISRAGDLAYAVYVAGLYRRDPREHVSGADALHPGCRYGGTEGAPCTDPERSDQ